MVAIEKQIELIKRETVENITDFGTFIDLGGVDGLLHITDIHLLINRTFHYFIT